MLLVPLAVLCCGLGPLLVVGVATVGASIFGGALIAVAVLAAGITVVAVRARRGRVGAPRGLGAPGDRR